MNVTDTHAHFWDVHAIRYPWIERGSIFDRAFLLEDYQRASAGLGITRMIFVECDADPHETVREAEWVTQLASRDPRIQGIVGRVSLCRGPPASETLHRMMSVSLLKGIRDNIQNNAPGFALQPDFVRGVQEAHGRGLHFELCLKHHQLSEVIELVRRCPDGMFVLDHCAKPNIVKSQREPWLTELHQLSTFKNVYCKISGLVTEADWKQWQPEEVLWYARESAQAFGAARIMFGSDWPVNEAAGGYVRWFRLAQELAAGWSSQDREAFFSGNAARVYRLL